jgi:CHAT domain-containing protein
VHEVAAVRQAQVLTGADASAAAVLAAMGRADTVHVAAHGRLRVDNPMFSALELADGPLTIYDLEQVRQAPRVVVLPACQSGQPDVRAGDEVMGLAQALLALGAEAVVATVVPVDDEATRPLMVDLHRRLAAGEPVATALALAQSGHDAGDPRSVAAAAAFVCFGAGLLPAPVSAAGPPAP